MPEYSKSYDEEVLNSVLCGAERIVLDAAVSRLLGGSESSSHTESEYVPPGGDWVGALVDLYRHIDSSGVFSKNEDVDDLDVESLRCMNVEYYAALAYDGDVGFAHGQSHSNSRSSLEQKKNVLLHYEGFLERCLQYGALEPEICKIAEKAMEEKEQPVNAGEVRQEKIALFSKERQLKRDIDTHVISCGEGASSEIRVVMLMVLNVHACKALKARHLVRQEIEMLESVERMSDREKDRCVQDNNRMAGELMGKLKEAVQGLTLESKRESLRQNVFKPSHILPTMTVEEYGEMEMRRLMNENASKSTQSKEVESSDDSDDEAALHKQRAWDDFKDDNPKGWGNSKTRPTG